MPSRKLTTRSVSALIRKAKTQQKALFLWDTELKGFGCRASTTGHVSWVFQYWLGGRGGKAQRISFAQYPPTTVDDARKQAEKLRGEVRSGVDVAQQKKAQLKQHNTELNTQTLSALVDAYLKERQGIGRYWSNVERILKATALPAFGAKTRITAVKKEDIRNLLKTKAHLPAAARNLFATLRPFFGWCVEEDYLTASPMADLKPPRAVQARDRILNEEEIAAFWRATDQLGYPFSPFYKLLLLTAQRREEVAGMQWSEIDLEAATWTIPKHRTKNGKEHLVHLSPQSLKVINNIERKQSEFVFTTTLKTPISGYSKAKAKLDELMEAELGEELKPWRVHDLRRTAASGMARVGVQPHIVERVLNHVSGANGGLVGVYQRYEYLEERRQTLELWANLVRRTTDGKVR